MAKEKIIEIKTGPAIKNIQDLKNNISEYKKELAGLEIGTNEYQNTLKALQTNQAALRNAMHGTTASMSEVMNAATAANVAFDNQNNLVKAETLSYNELVRELDILKQQWRATTNAAERLDLGRRIDNVNNRLKQLDSTVGVYGRNVGNYVGALQQFSAGFASMGKGAAAAVNPIRNTTMALQTMSKTPAVAILGLIANLLASVIGNLKSSEENANSTAKAFSVFAAAGDLVKNTMQLLGKALSSVVGWFTNLLQNIFPRLREMAELRAEITEKEIALSYKQREATEKNADAELVIAKRRQEAADKTGKTAEERIALLKEANDLELAVSRRSVEIAQAEYEIQKLRAKTAANSKEENDALAAAYANVRKAQTDYYKRSRELTAQIVEAEKQARADRERIMQLDVTALQLALNERQGDLTEAMDIELAIEEKTYQIKKEKAEAEILDEKERVRTLEVYQIEHEQKMLGIARKYSDLSNEQTVLQFENRMNSFKEGSIQYLEAAVEMREYELQAVEFYGRRAEETEEEYLARRLAAEKAFNEEKKKLVAARVQGLQDAMTATSGIFNSLADIYEGNTKQTKQEAERVKNLRIAGATIDMLNGVVSAISTAQELGPIAGPIMAAINSAAVITAGVANIAKIRNTKVSTSSASTTAPAVAQAPAIEPQLTQVRTLTGATEEDRLNRMADRQRVYILDSDIEAKRDERRVQVEETTF